MKTATLFCLISLLAITAQAAAPINFKDISSTNVVKTNDLLLIDSNLGAGSYATRTIALQQALDKVNAAQVTALQTNVTLASLGVDTNLFAPLASPALTGNPTINGQSVETQLTNKVAKAGDTMTGDLTVPVLQSIKAIRSYQGTLTHAGNTTLNFDAPNTVNTMVTTGNCVFVFSGLATNRTYRLRLINSQATNIMITFPSGIVTATNWSGGYPGTNMTAGAVAMWSMEAWGSADGDVFNAWGQAQ